MPHGFVTWWQGILPQFQRVVAEIFEEPASSRKHEEGLNPTKQRAVDFRIENVSLTTREIMPVSVTSVIAEDTFKRDKFLVTRR